MTNRIDPIAAARALIETLAGYTPGPWDASGLTVYDTCMDGVASCHADADARLMAAAPDLRDMVATLADALETERAKVAAAYELAAEVYWYGFPAWDAFSAARDAIRALTPADAQASLDKLLAEARLEGWRAGREAAAHACDWGDIYGAKAVQAIRALPEPKEAIHD